MAGTWVAVARMPAQRAHSQAYLAVILGRAPHLTEVWRHFLAVTDSLLLNLRAGKGAPVRCTLANAHSAAFETLVRSPQPALFGTFHFGDSDLLGYMLAERGRRVSIIRLRVENSEDTRLLGERFRGVSFMWINDPTSLLFQLKAALEAGESLALKCDRLEFSARTEPFQFLGARRLFPFTIYYLSVLFTRPVIFCFAVATSEANHIQVFSTAVFTPNPQVEREANLQVARVHFQAVLAQLEVLLRQNPYLWFNFLPLNPPVTND